MQIEGEAQLVAHDVTILRRMSFIARVTRPVVAAIIWLSLTPALAAQTDAAPKIPAPFPAPNWLAEFEGSCPPIKVPGRQIDSEDFLGGTEASYNLSQIRSAPGRVSIARGGVYDSRLPTLGRRVNIGVFPGENTPVAYKWAACLGFVGVEIDLRKTRDDRLLFSRDENAIRLTKLNGSSQSHGLWLNGAISLQENEADEPIITRQPRTHVPPIRDISFRDDLRPVAEYVRGTNNYGREAGIFSQIWVKTAGRQMVTLLGLKYPAPTSPDTSDLVLILNLHSGDALDLTLQQLKTYNDASLNRRTILKIPADATSFARHSDEWVFVLNEAVTGLNYVLSFSGQNIRVDDTGTYIKVRDVTEGTPIETEISFERFLEAVKAYQASTQSILGYEILVSGATIDDQPDCSGNDSCNRAKDAALLEIDRAFVDWPNSGRKWGSDRQQPDFWQAQCRDVGHCDTFPDGAYYSDTVLVEDGTESYGQLNLLPDTIVRARSVFANTRDIRSQRIGSFEYDGYKPLLHSPQFRTVLLLAIGSI